MEFWASAEVFNPAFEALERVRRAVEPYLNAKFKDSSIVAFECKLRYVPIVMPVEMHNRYPARSRLNKKSRICDCAPLLNYDVYLRDSFSDQLYEYIRGIEDAIPYLQALGASPEQVNELKAILKEAAKDLSEAFESNVWH